MTIEFTHLNQPATAFIMYNLKQVGEAFLLTPLSYKEDLGEKVLIYKVKDTWQTDSGLHKKFPETFSNIITEFEKIATTNANSDTQFLSIKDEIKQGGQHENEQGINESGKSKFFVFYPLSKK